MRRNAIIGLLIFWMALSLLAGPAAASSSKMQDDLLAACQKVQQVLILPANMSAEQRALVTLNIAIAQTQPLDGSVDIAELLRQASSFTTYQVKSDTFYNWSTDPTDHWEGTHRSTYGYSGTRQTSSVVQTFDGSTWTNANQTLTAYNGDGTVNTITQQEWQTSLWVNRLISTFTYSGGMPTTIISQTWSGTAWVNYTRLTLAYSGANLATMTTELWQTSAWVNSSKTTYTYSGAHVTETVIQAWQASAWVNQMRFTSTYNGSGDETQSITYMWQTSSWVTTYKDDYSYDGSHNEILDVSSTWAVTLWMAMEADTLKWSGGKNTEIVYNYLIPPSVSRTQYTYDGNGNETVNLGQDLSGAVWENTDRGVRVYQAALAVEVDNGRMPSVFELSQNYPNPFNPITAIRYSLHRPSQVSITVFNLLGQEVKTLESGMQSAGTYETTWDGTNGAGQEVASGIYFYRIKAGENIETRKMLLLK
jgi:hypothetical protein